MAKFKKSAEARRNISKGVKASWRKRGVKLAAGTAVVGASTLALYKNRKNILNSAEKLATSIDKKMAPKVEKFVYEAIKNPKPNSKVGKILSRFTPKESMKAAGVGAAKAAKDITIETVEQQAKNVANLPKTAVNLGRETRRTVQEGLNTPNDPNSKLNQGARWLARQRVKMEKRAREDMKKLGFEQNLSDVGLIEFAKTQRRKKRTAAERAAISQGLREYYATQPKPKKSVLDKVDRGALSVNRVTRTTSNILSTAAMGLSLAGQLKALTYKPSRGERIFQNVSAGAGLLSTVSGAYRGFGTGTRSFAGSANIYDDLRIGAKNRRFGLTEQRLGLERSKQVLAKDRAKSYRIIANTSAKSNSPGGTKFEDMVTRRGKFEQDYGTDVIPNIKANLRKKPKER